MGTALIFSRHTFSTRLQRAARCPLPKGGDVFLSKERHPDHLQARELLGCTSRSKGSRKSAPEKVSLMLISMSLRIGFACLACLAYE